MVLSRSTLATFKADDEPSFTTKTLVSDIKSVDVIDMSGLAVFKVSTHKQSIVFFSEETNTWVRRINQHLNGLKDFDPLVKSEGAIRSIFAGDTRDPKRKRERNRRCE